MTLGSNESYEVAVHTGGMFEKNWQVLKTAQQALSLLELRIQALIFMTFSHATWALKDFN